MILFLFHQFRFVIGVCNDCYAVGTNGVERPIKPLPMVVIDHRFLAHIGF